MSTANDPTSSTTPQESLTAPSEETQPAPAAESSIPLPPLTRPARKETSPERLAVEFRRLDWVIVGLVVILAFLLASFAVRNSDFWIHLATGRLAANGEWNFGSNPFAYSTPQTYWANHSWLYDLALYGVARLTGGPESVGGGAVLVVLKAILFTFLAWVMLQIRRPGQHLWAPAFCTGLALIAMSPRLLFQPTLFSLLFLGITLCVLQAPRHEEIGPGRNSLARSPLNVYWLLPPLFALWVNVDEWFLLGPVTVALYLIGVVLQQLTAPIRTGTDAPEPRQPLILFLVFIVGVTACLINPYGYRAFTLPVQLGLTDVVDVYRQDSLLRHYFDSPFDQDYFRPGIGMNVAGLAYFPLVGLGLASFVLSFFATWRWWRLLIWLFFAALSGYESRNIPFFAVVAGPITALNLQDFAAVRLGMQPRLERGWRLWSIGGRLVTILLVLGVLLLTWPGWLHGRPSDPMQVYRVGWSVDIEPSFRQSAEQLKSWHEAGLIRDEDHGFNFTPEVMNYCAWFCANEQGHPLEKGYFDYRLSAYSKQVATDYVDLRQVLRNPGQSTVPGGRQVNWQKLFRDQHISHLVVNLRDPDGAFVWISLLNDWQQWPLIYLDGRTIIFRWQDPRHRGQQPLAAIPRMEPEIRAFGAAATLAPAKGPEKPPEPQDLWTRYAQGPPPLPLATDRAMRWLDYWNVISRRWFGPYLLASDVAAWSAVVGASPFGLGGGTVAPASNLVLSSLPVRFAFANPQLLSYFLRFKDQGPPGSPLLAVRTCREALLTNSNDPVTYFTLGRAYSLLLEQEDQWVGRTQAAQRQFPRDQLRRMQMTTALEYDLKVRPDNADTHLRLFQIYSQIRFNDFALDRLREYVRLIRATGPQEGEKREDFEQRLERSDNILKNLDDQVTRQRNEYEVSAANQPPVVKAQIAVSRGLPSTAITVLQQSLEPDTVPEPAVLNILVELYLATGQPEEARPGLGEGMRQVLGTNYEWLNTLMEAEAGNYGQAGAYLDQLLARTDQENAQQALVMLRAQTFMGVSPQTVAALNNTLGTVRQAADLRLVRGLLALEEGDTATAATALRKTLEMGQPYPFNFEGRAIALNYLRHLEESGGATAKR
jgi:tetratricopeptide (TPR) repeat protein